MTRTASLSPAAELLRREGLGRGRQWNCFWRMCCVASERLQTLHERSSQVLQLTENDAAFILGRGGKSKHKIARVSGVQLELHETNNTIELIGTDLERKKARS